MLVSYNIPLAIGLQIIEAYLIRGSRVIVTIQSQLLIKISIIYNNRYYDSAFKELM